ncbi:phage tail protein [Collimonas sp. NPDC087041]|uniref:phage tail protein n=1 Tax=Collimonas sp. NPDC087041 TaxID=3363960 RepID=UPI00380F8F44
MAKKVFTWLPKNEATGTTKFDVLTARFGDGYKQTAENGINNRSESWPLTFVGNKARIMAIMNFLDSCSGARSFLWTPPLSEQILVKAGGYTRTPNGGGVYTLTVTFEQDFQA